MADTGLPQIYDPFNGVYDFLGYLAEQTQTGFQSVFGTMTPKQIEDGKAAVAAQVARAGGSPEQQQQAAAQYEKAAADATKAFNENSLYSNVLQRAENYAVGTGDASDIIQIPKFDFSNLTGAAGVAAQVSSWGFVLLVVGLLIVAFLFLKEVL